MSDPAPSLDAAIEAAWLAYGARRLEDALAAADRAVAIDAQNGRAWFVRACIIERLGQLREADHCFTAAAHADRDRQPLPYRTTWWRFERAVEHAADALPAQLRPRLAELEIVLADHPEPDQVRLCDNPEALGLSIAAEPTRKRGPRLHLFRRPHEHCASNAREFAAEVRRTLHHEFGRYLGYDAGEMGRQGLL